MSPSGQQSEKEVGETVAPSLTLKKFDKVGGQACVEDRSEKIWQWKSRQIP